MYQKIRQAGLAAAFALVLGVLVALSCAEEAISPSAPSSASTEISNSLSSKTSAVSNPEGTTALVSLPPPSLDGNVSLEKAIQERRSVREYADAPLIQSEISQLLWAAQGITSPQGGRAAPSAGGTYPLEIYLVAGAVTGLESGVYRYVPEQHSLMPVKSGDFRHELQKASLDQPWVGAAPVDFVIAAVYERTTQRYGDRGVRYVHLEAGHAAQNLCLEATALGLGAVTVGAFTDEQVQAALSLPAQAKPLYVIPVGRKPGGS